MGSPRQRAPRRPDSRQRPHGNRRCEDCLSRPAESLGRTAEWRIPHQERKRRRRRRAALVHDLRPAPQRILRQAPRLHPRMPGHEL